MIHKFEICRQSPPKEWKDTCPRHGHGYHVCESREEHPGSHTCGCSYRWLVGEPKPTQKVDDATLKANDRFAGLSMHEALLASGAVKRYHTHPHVLNGPQTVAEHTFRCMALMVSLWPECPRQALVTMMQHDGAEGAIGDISSTVKLMHPDLGSILYRIEAGVQARLGMYVEDDQEPEVQLWIRICDWLEGAFYAIDQIAMGNNGMYMCHNAFILSLNRLLNASDEGLKVLIRIKSAHHSYLRHPNGQCKVDLAFITFIELTPAPQQSHS